MSKTIQLQRGAYLQVLSRLQAALPLDPTTTSISLTYAMGRNARLAVPLAEAWNARLKEIDSPEYLAYTKEKGADVVRDDLDTVYKVVLADRAKQIEDANAWSAEIIDVEIIPISIKDLPADFDRQLLLEALDFLSD